MGRGARLFEPLTLGAAILVCLLFCALLRDVSGGARGSGEARAGVARRAAVDVAVVDAAGGPIAGVRLRMFVLGEGRAWLAAEVASDAAGRAALDALPAGPAWLVAERAGLARATVPLGLGDGRKTVRLAMGPAERFEVVVVDSLQRPLAGAQATLRGSDAFAHLCRTDDRGACVLGGLGPPPYALEVAAAGFESKHLAPLDADASPAFVRLERLGGIEVAVRDAEGGAASGARVLCAGSALWPARALVTDAEGRASLDGLPRGYYDLRAERGELVSDGEAGLVLERGERRTVELRLVRGRFVDVRVTDGEGEARPPVAGADVTLVEAGISSFPRHARTGPEGRARLGPLAPSAERGLLVSARADGFVARSAVPLPAGMDALTLGLERGGRLHGRVVDEAGFPVGDVRLEVAGVGTDGMPVLDDGAMGAFRAEHFGAVLPGALPLLPAGELGVTPFVPAVPFASLGTPAASFTHGAPSGAIGRAWASGPDGGFELAPVAPGALRVIARHPAFVETVSEPVTLEASGAVALTVVLRQGGLLEGRVLEDDRSPVAGARVELGRPEGGDSRVTFSADDGTFALVAMPARVRLSVARPDAPAEIALRVEIEIPAGGHRDVELVLPERREPVALRVLDDRGYPLERVEVRAHSLDPEVSVVRTLFTDDAGEAILPGARGLGLRVLARRRGQAPLVRELDSAPAEITLTLERALRVRGEVREARGGAPLAGVEVRLVAAFGERLARTGPDGGFELDDLGPALARLLVTRSGYAPDERLVRVEGEGTRVHDVGRIALAAAGVVTGRVVDAAGKPVVGARVARGRVPTHLPLGPLPAGVVATDADGRFVLADVPAGPAVLEAFKPGVARAASAPLEVRAGEETGDVRIALGTDAEPEEPPLAALAPSLGSLAVTLSEASDGARARVRVEHVPLGGEAHRAGVFAGDRLLSVGGRRVRSLAHARALLTGPLGEDLVLELARDNERLRLRVPRERLRR
jgi:hypothetical protein